ncbi:MAG TPA: GNAT family N-acetyltransferase [Pyrinomonadaceae bacterium]|nr:GNAT family N-acetyltransferase [Pyrinomonadaceae bacterium]
MDYRLIPTTGEDQDWLEQLRRHTTRELVIATWGCWDEARHLRHCAECWERGGISVIEVNGERAGMIQLLEHADEIEVGEIQIQPAYQGRGIGTWVLSDTISRAHARGKKVSLATGLKNRRAFELYERLGFRLVAQSDTHYHMECEPG